MTAATLLMPIELEDLGVRAYNIAKRHGVRTIGDLAAVTVNDANQWAAEGHALGLPAARQIMDVQRRVALLWPAGIDADVYSVCAGCAHQLTVDPGCPPDRCESCGRDASWISYFEHPGDADEYSESRLTWLRDAAYRAAASPAWYSDDRADYPAEGV